MERTGLDGKDWVLWRSPGRTGLSEKLSGPIKSGKTANNRSSNQPNLAGIFDYTISTSDGLTFTFKIFSASFSTISVVIP